MRDVTSRVPRLVLSRPFEDMLMKYLRGKQTWKLESL